MKIWASLFFVSTLTFSWSSRWIQVYDSDQIEWKKVYSLRGSNEEISEKCFLTSVDFTSVGEVKNHNFYESDTIRIYIDKQDSLLNKITKSGLLQGHYFFSPELPNLCQPKRWANPSKSHHNGWHGYNFYLTGLKELETVGLPSSIKEKVDLYKVFEVSFRFVDQPFVNPSVYRFELTNTELKCHQDTVSFEVFIENARTTLFFKV